MKKILSVFLVAGILVACDDSKKEEKTTTTTETTETKTDGKDAPADTKVSTTTTTTTSVEVPKFADADVQKLATEYAAFMADPAMASDPAKAQEWATKSQSAMTKLAASPDELKKWNDFMMNLSKAQMDKMPK